MYLVPSNSQSPRRTVRGMRGYYAAGPLRRRTLGALGLPVTTSPAQLVSTGSGARIIAPATVGKICPAWGCGTPPIRITSPIASAPPTTVQSTTPASANPNGATAQQVAGTPVPVGFNLNSIFVNSDGSQWIYSTAQGKWIDVGTPYNPNSGGVAPASTSSASYYPGTPVPSTYPTNQIFTDSAGNEWVWNASAGTWTLYASASSLQTGGGSTSTALTTTYYPGTDVPVGTPDNQTYTDAAGNVWTYANGAWTMTSAASGGNEASSILNWFPESTLISGIPNWVIALGVGLVAWKLMQQGKGR